MVEDGSSAFLKRLEVPMFFIPFWDGKKTHKNIAEMILCCIIPKTSFHFCISELLSE